MSQTEQEEQDFRRDREQDFRDHVKKRGILRQIEIFLMNTFHMKKHSVDNLFIIKLFAKKIFTDQLSELYPIPKFPSEINYFYMINRNFEYETRNIYYSRNSFELRDWLRNYFDFPTGGDISDAIKIKSGICFKNRLNPTKEKLFPYEYFYLKFIWYKLNNRIIGKRIQNLQKKRDKQSHDTNEKGEWTS